jgi:hypothetical protein
MIIPPVIIAVGGAIGMTLAPELTSHAVRWSEGPSGTDRPRRYQRNNTSDTTMEANVNEPQRKTRRGVFKCLGIVLLAMSTVIPLAQVSAQETTETLRQPTVPHPSDPGPARALCS